MTASGIPVDAVMEIVSAYGDDEFSVRSDLLDDLRTRQRELDERDREKHEKSMELLDAQIEAEKVRALNPGSGFAPGGKSKVLTSSSGGEGYSKLEQKRHEKSKGTAATRESLQRKQGRSVK